MSPEEKDERERLAATPNLPDYSRTIIRHPSTPIDLARKIVALAAPTPAAASAAMRAAAERAERLDAQMGITGGPIASFDSRTLIQTFGESKGGR
jgi:poly-beta-hydroxyalkanoate depolymerase